MFELMATSGTSPMFLIDYNDSSPIQYPTSVTLNSSYFINHTFPDSGLYYVNVTFFNNVSSASKIILVNFVS